MQQDKHSNRSTTEARDRQRQRHAEHAKRKVQQRREKQSGAAGWIADRAGEWSLEGPDWDFMEQQRYLWNPLMDYWFRMEFEGWENIPEPPVLLVGVHSGAPFVWDAWTVGVQWWRHFGRSRPIHGTAHDALMALPLIGDYFRRMGVVPAAPDSMASALAAGHDVALWPGGERDSLRQWTRRDEAVLAGRTGFIRLAINSGVPIVPISTIGGPDAMPILATGRRFAKLLRLDKVARLKVFPVALQAPWGLSPALLPEIPFPTKIRTAFQPPIELDHDPQRSSDDDYVEAKYEEARDSIQRGMDELARRRALPLFG
ncbi:MAG TPA: lysophospholipid acyltransferase family protein [Solirubrobacterales bacterium]|jgi:1-acyl-sn-glycerol-3-phosphate acyltransferase|nr:lysophospholipid acyltransferase family protein [Solirubrobacterales bacterium]